MVIANSFIFVFFRSKTLIQEHENFDSKLVDLKARSMRDNLIFYGIPEGGEHEDCKKLVKGLCEKTLDMLRAHELKFDRVHRVGSKSGTKVRPIVAKFHYNEEREYARKIAFHCNEALKVANQGVGAQLPKSIRDARKPLYPAMKKAKDDGKNYVLTERSINRQQEQYRQVRVFRNHQPWTIKDVVKSVL